MLADPRDPRTEEFDIPWDVFFTWHSYVKRCNNPAALPEYQKTWTGSDYSINMGKWAGCTISQVNSTRWLTWALNHFDLAPSDLRRALMDQLNALHY